MPVIINNYMLKYRQPKVCIKMVKKIFFWDPSDAVMQYDFLHETQYW